MAHRKNIIALAIRLIVGGIFIYAGWLKIAAMTDTVTMFQSMGIGAIATYLVSYGEFLGGIAIVLGLWAEAAAIGLSIIMIGAVYYSRMGGFPMMSGPLATLAAVLSIVESGAGKYALNRFIPKSWKA